MFLLTLMVLVVAAVAVGLWAANVTVSTTMSGDINAQSDRAVTGETPVIAKPTVPKAWSAVLTIRTNDTSGSLTMDSASHPVTTGSRVDLYWTNGRCYRALVGTVSGTTVPIVSVAGGSVLPAAASGINVGIVVVAPFPVEADVANALALTVQVAGYIVLVDKVGTAETVRYAAYVTPSAAVMWDEGNGLDSFVDGVDVTEVHMSQSDTTASTTGHRAAAVISN